MKFVIFDTLRPIKAPRLIISAVIGQYFAGPESRGKRIDSGPAGNYSFWLMTQTSR
ncbi:hypothetical protein [Sporobacter termitidis]|uniref:hypothetical protein n=1 Tax=Sporobacter termitidis TaxID=44749 RepID=UPI0013563014|nr:hypothetical protein [Sporobacter termitidis]